MAGQCVSGSFFLDAETGIGYDNGNTDVKLEFGGFAELTIDN